MRNGAWDAMMPWELQEELQRWVAQGDAAAVAALLGRVPASHLDCEDEQGRTALYTACVLGSADLVALLIKHGADVDVPDRHGETPLSHAAAEGKLDVVELLCRAGADPQTPGATGTTPLARAEAQGHHAVAACVRACEVQWKGKYLAEAEEARRPTVAKHEAVRRAALEEQFRHALRQTIECIKVRQLREFVSGPVDSDDSGDDEPVARAPKKAPLRKAAKKGAAAAPPQPAQPSAAEDPCSPPAPQVSEHTLPVDKVLPGLLHPRHVSYSVASEALHSEVTRPGRAPALRGPPRTSAEDLAALAAARLAQQRRGSSPAASSVATCEGDHSAAHAPQPSEAALSSSASSVVSLISASGGCPDTQKTLKAFLSSYQMLAALNQSLGATRQGHEAPATPPSAVPQRILRTPKIDSAAPQAEPQARVDAFDAYKRLCAAAHKGDLEGCKRLAAVTQVERSDCPGHTPFVWAVVGGQLDVVKWLLERGARPDQRDGCGYTPLVHAVQHRHLEMVKFLAALDPALLRAVDHEGHNLVHWAAFTGSMSILRALVEVYRLDPNAVDREGKSALHWAAHQNRAEASQYLAQLSPGLLVARDRSGRTAAVEACHRGHADIAQFLNTQDEAFRRLL